MLRRLHIRRALPEPRARLLACAIVCVSLVAAVGTVAPATGAASSWWKVDTHQHSAYSGDAKADLGLDAQLAQHYGYNAVFLTDHDRGTGFQINYANGNYQSFTNPTKWTSSGDSTWAAKGTGGGAVPVLASNPAHGGTGSSIHLAATASTSTAARSLIYADRGPALNAGDVTLSFWMYPQTLTGAAGADVSVSLGGDSTSGAKAIGYTDSGGVSHGLTTPAKSTVLVWQVGAARKQSVNGTTDVFVNQLHAPTLATWNHYTVDVKTGATTWTDGAQSASGSSTTRLNNLPVADQPDNRMVVLTYDKIEAATTGTGTADVYFDDYVAEDTTPNCPAQEFADRDAIIDSGVYNTASFAIYPAREMGQNYHVNQFVFDPRAASDYVDKANDTPKIPEPYGDDAALCAASNAAASASAPSFAYNGIDNIPFVQQTGYPVQLNHPGITETVANAVAGNDHGADLVEVQNNGDFSSPWDQVLATGHQIIGTYGSDAHRGVGPTAPSDFIYAPTFGRDDLLSALNAGLSFMAVGNFTGHIAFNLDNGAAPYAARTPVMVPAGATTTVYLNIDGGLPAGATVKWFSSSGALDANKLAPQLGPIDSTAGSYHGQRSVTLSGAYTYVRAAVYDSAGKLYANTQPIFFRPNGGGGGGGGGGTLPPFTATADAYVVQTSPTTSYGTSPKLRVDSDPATNSYLRFNVQGVAGTVTGVQLKIYATSSLAAGFSVNAVADDSWTDTGATAIRWNTAPAIGPKITASPAAVANSYVTVNLPASTVSGNGDVNLALTPNSTTALAFASREDTDPTHRPQLIVTTS